MMPESVRRLVDALKRLPTVGEKSANRLALFLLERNPKSAQQLVDALSYALINVQKCQECRNLSDHPLCTICENSERTREQLCIVEAPSDVYALERSTNYRGRYFVLHGRLSPLDGIGPEELGLSLLAERLASGEIEELILATNSTVEGEATAYYIDELAQQYQVPVTRIAQGVPMGGELDHLDADTLSLAFSARKRV